MVDHSQILEQLLPALGGKENVSHSELTDRTLLVFVKDRSLTDLVALREVEGVAAAEINRNRVRLTMGETLQEEQNEEVPFMASKYDGLARIIIQNVGGKGNIIALKHCVTRLRFTLKDESLANTDILKNTDGVVTVLQAGGQYQVVIGSYVDYVYDAVIDVGHLQSATAGADQDDTAADDDGDGKKRNLLNMFIDVVSAVIQPTLGVLGASGIVKGLLACLTYFHLLESSSGTYQVLYAFADGFFYFLPIFLGYTAAKKFKMNEFIGMALGASLVYPNMVALKGAEALGTAFAGTAFEMSYTTTFLGFPVFFPAAGYTSSVIPIILACLLGSKLYKWGRKVIPDVLQMFLLPLLVILVMMPLTYLIIGPVSGLLCGVLQWVFNLVYNLPVIGGALAAAFVGFIWQICIIFGVHWGLTPLMYINLATMGFDYVLTANIACSWTQFAALGAVLVKSKDEKMKKITVPAFISAFFGVTEPAIYGITLPKKKPFYITCVASAIGGIIMGSMGVVKYMTGGMGLFALPCFIDPNEGGVGMRNLIIACIAILVAMVISFVGTMIVWQDTVPKKKKDQEPDAFADEDAVPAGPAVVYSPVAGSAKPITECKDEVFASETLGKGVVIDPSEGKLYAPFNGTVSNLAETLHAVGLQSEDGTEILIHV
ncbi:MAG: PTS transporter subunit EIIC, partial [Lachnospiraceae bacterium]|nr:PTS transporter subunit EIIC [Lachnospiraceae bacterium]